MKITQKVKPPITTNDFSDMEKKHNSLAAHKETSKEKSKANHITDTDTFREKFRCNLVPDPSQPRLDPTGFGQTAAFANILVIARSGGCWMVDFWWDLRDADADVDWGADEGAPRAPYGSAAVEVQVRSP
jgi:hypothetical protein